MNNVNSRFGCVVLLLATATAAAEDTAPSVLPAHARFRRAISGSVAKLFPTQQADQPDQPESVVTEQYSTGELNRRYEIVLDEQGNSVRHGQWTMWDKSGAVIGEGTFHHGERHGQWTRVTTQFMPPFDGIVLATPDFNAFQLPYLCKAEFQHGKLHGTWTIEDGGQRKMCEWNYEGGLRHGRSISYDPQGIKRSEVEFRRGVIHGRRREFDQQSNIVLEETYDDGRRVTRQVDYFDDAPTQKESERMILTARLVVKSPADFWNAYPEIYKTEGADQRHGLSTLWFKNGQQRMTGHYHHEQREGAFTWWHANGQVSAEGVYRNDRADSRWVWYHSNGQKAAEGSYLDGKPTGLWMHWNETGDLTRRKDHAEQKITIIPTPEEIRDTAAIPNDTVRE